MRTLGYLLIALWLALAGTRSFAFGALQSAPPCADDLAGAAHHTAHLPAADSLSEGGPVGCGAQHDHTLCSDGCAACAHAGSGVSSARSLLDVARFPCPASRGAADNGRTVAPILRPPTLDSVC